MFNIAAKTRPYFGAIVLTAIFLSASGVYSGGPIYRQGRYLGNDPDPRVRFEIARDPYFGRK